MADTKPTYEELVEALHMTSLALRPFAECVSEDERTSIITIKPRQPTAQELIEAFLWRKSARGFLTRIRQKGKNS